MKTYSPRVFNGRTPPFKLTRFRFVETYREESVKRLKKKKKISSESCVIFIPRLNTGKKKKIEIESKRAEFCYWLLFLRKIYIFLYDLCCYVGERERRILLFVIRSDQR